MVRLTDFLLRDLLDPDFRARSKAIATFCLLVRFFPALVLLRESSLILADIVFWDFPFFNGIIHLFYVIHMDMWIFLFTLKSILLLFIVGGLVFLIEMSLGSIPAYAIGAFIILQITPKLIDRYF